MSIRQLKTLIAVADHSSFTTAAAAVHVTHAAVSHQMKALELDWGVKLFDRSARTPALTPIGRAMVAKAREVVAAYDGIVQSVTNESGFMGELAIGAVPTTLSGLIPKVLVHLKEEHPKLHVRIVPGLSTDLLAQVERSALDGAIITRPTIIPRRHRWQEIAKEELMLVASLEAEGDDAVELLKNTPYIRFARKAMVGSMIEGWLQQQKFDVVEGMELETLDAIGSLVHANLGVSIIPKLSFPPAVQFPLRHLPLNPPPPQRELGLLSRDDSVKPNVLNVLVEKARLVTDTNNATSNNTQSG